MFWMLTAFKYVKDFLVPERIWNVLFVKRKWCLNSYGKYLGTVRSKTTLETAHTISLISPSKSSCIVEWNETVWTRRDPFDTKKFSNFSPEILVEWKAPPVSLTQVYSSCSSVHEPLPKWKWLWARKSIIWRKLQSGTSKTKELVPVQPEFPLFRKS